MRRIERLSESVINRIAAGEVVQRPSAALKEILENALDAGSTSIQVIVRDGGMELLQVTDDGHGIHRDDLPLLCERYATSKLRAFEELSCIHSFGFRGEALSSISYVARVTVTTMRRAENTALAWRCQFMDGVMQSEPQPCAGNPGTTIRVERMFYNSLVRRRALSRASEEYSRIVSVVSRYALAFPHVSFACRRDEPNVGGVGAKAELFFPKDSTTLANIGIFHGTSTAANLHALHCVGVGPCSSSAAAVLSAPADAEGCFHISGFTSGVALANRRAQLCLFANNRLVESSVIRRALDTVYSSVLTGGQRPFTVLFITVPPGRIDVNIHPTKHEVALLDEEIIVARLSEGVRGVLAESAAQRRLDPRHALAKAAGIADRSPTNAFAMDSGISGGRAVVAPCTIVRVEPQRGALDAFVRHSVTTKTARVQSEAESHTPCLPNVSQPTPTPTPITISIPPAAPSTCALTPPASQVWTQERSEKALASQNESNATDDVTSTRMQMGSLSDAPTPSLVVRTEITPSFSIPASILQLDQATTEDEDEKENIMADFKRHRHEIQASACGTTSPDPAAVHANIFNEVNEGNEAKEVNHTSDAVVVVGQEDLLLTSIATIVAQLRAASTPTASALFDAFTYVGVLSPQHFLAQSGTTLYAVDTLRLVRIAVYQRVFFRWAHASLPAPPQLVLQEPMRIADLLRFAMQHDGATLRSHMTREKVAKKQSKTQEEEEQEQKEEERTEEDRMRVVGRLDRRLRHWRCMLQEYFAIDISADGHLLALPFGLNTSWPPVPRVVPLFVWRLAAEVPYGEDEIACFTAIAQHIAKTLYGMRLHDAWMRPRSENDDNNNNYNNGDDTRGEAYNEEANERRKGDGERQRQRTGQASSPSLGDAIRFGLVPCVTSAKFFAPPADTLVDGTLQAVVSVEELYKVFERC